MIARNKPETFKSFYEQTFRPARIAGKSAMTIENWDRSVRVFLQFAGDDADLATIGERRLAEFAAWARELGIGDISATDHARHVRSIVRESEPVEVDEDDEKRDAARRVAASSTAGDGTVMQYLETEYVPCRDLAVRTIEHYRATIQSLGKFLDRDALLSDLSDDLLNRYLDSSKARGLRPATIHSQRADVLVMWRAAEFDGLIDTVPRRVRRIKVPRERITAWSLEELTAIVRATESMDCYSTVAGDNGRITFHRGKMLKAFILTGWDIALRCGDLLRLKRSDIADDGRIALIQHKTDHPHVCMVRPETIAAIDDTFLHPRTRIFEVKPSWINCWFGVLVSKSHQVDDRKKAHKLRRSSGSHVQAIKPGAGPQHLGHTPQGLFGRHYDDLSISRAEPTLPPPIPGYQAEPNGNGNTTGNGKPATTPPPLPGKANGGAA